MGRKPKLKQADLDSKTEQKKVAGVGSFVGEESDPNDPDGPYLKTLKEVALHYGISCHTVTTKWRRNGMPGSNGRWGIGAITAWRSTRRSAPAGRPGSPSSQNGSTSSQDGNRGYDVDVLLARQRAEARYKQAKAEDAEFELQRKRGEFYDRAAVDQWWSECIISTREEAVRIVQDLRPQLPRGESGERILEEVKRRIESFLIRMAGWRPSVNQEE